MVPERPQNGRGQHLIDDEHLPGNLTPSVDARLAQLRINRENPPERGLLKKT